MNVLICSSALNYQVDAPYSTRERANAIIRAGVSSLVLGFPEKYPDEGRQHLFDYISVLASCPESKRKRMSALKERLGRYWDFIIEPFLVLNAAYILATQNNCDLIYITHLEPWLIPLVVAWQKIRGRWKPTAGMIPSLFYSREVAKGLPLSSRSRGWLNHVFSRWLPGFMDVIGNTKYVPEILKMIPGPTVHMIPEGYEVLDPFPSQVEARKKLGMPPDRRMLLLFGAAGKTKGADTLFKAMEGVPPSFLVCVVGKTGGVYCSSWGETTKLQELGWEDYLHVVPRYVTDEEMHAYYAACDAVVIPFSKGFGAASTHLRRASEYGKAIIASDQYLIGDMVRDYELGLLFPPEDVEGLRKCLIEFSGKPQAWFDRIQENSRKVVQQYAWNAIGLMYKQLFEGMLKKAR